VSANEDRLRHEIADAYMNRTNWDESEARGKIQARTPGGASGGNSGCPLWLIALPVLLPLLLLLRAVIAMAAELTPEQRALRARLASHTSWAQMPDPQDRRDRTAKARRNSPVTFEYHLDRVPDEITDPEARRKAAQNAHSAHMTRLALRSSQSRARRSKPA
jgi:hypothetical protein